MYKNNKLLLLLIVIIPNKTCNILHTNEPFSSTFKQ